MVDGVVYNKTTMIIATCTVSRYQAPFLPHLRRGPGYEANVPYVHVCGG